MRSPKAADNETGMDPTISLAVSRLYVDISKLYLDVLSSSSFQNVKLQNVEITSSSLQNVEIRDSKIISCRSVTNCRIYNCVIEVSKICDSTICNSRIDTVSDVVRSSITNSRIQRSEIFDSKAKNSSFVACSEISKTSIDDSDVEYSTLNKCTVSNSDLYKTHRINEATISGSTLSHSWLTNCIVKDSYFDRCQKIHLTCPQLSLRKFPVEVRSIIFEKALKWDGKGPGLLVALRGDKKLYYEALKVFYDINPLFYGVKQFEKFYHDVVAPKYIKKLNIDSSHAQKGVPCPRWLELGQVRQLRVVANSTFLWLGNNWLKTLKTVEKLTIVTPEAKGRLVQIQNKGIEIINSRLGIIGKRDPSSLEGEEIWTWEAVPNQTLLWTPLAGVQEET
ncbi:hypothetical protein B7494_g3684 [Chlorociboria aeruginascens]|nr:hypothetical protein B7494_g3684 [Chlorociboria aeruginascens]